MNARLATASSCRRAATPGSASPTTATSGRSCRTDRGVLDRQRGAGVQPGQPLLPLRAGHHDPGHGRRLVHDPEDRRAAQRAFQSSPGIPLAANYAVSSGHRRAVARTRAVGQRDERDVNLLKPGEVVRRAGQPARLPRRQGPALRPSAGDHFGRPVQRVELRRDPRPTTRRSARAGPGWRRRRVLTARTTKITVQWDF